MNIAMETILAALVDQNDGELFLGKEFMNKNYEGWLLAITPDPLRDGIKFELIEQDKVTYDEDTHDNK